MSYLFVFLACLSCGMSGYALATVLGMRRELALLLSAPVPDGAVDDE